MAWSLTNVFLLQYDEEGEEADDEVKLPQPTKAYILEVVDWSCPVLCVQEGEEEADEENDPDYDPKVRGHV